MNFQGLEFDGVPTDSDAASDDNESVSSLLDEDVDFGHVYALFHFPQMVDGQVTVQEGEKLTLLDDSNSYWWLVQNLRDNQMGYIPADNIETAFGKLARVNRRKNLKLCKPDPEHILHSRIPTVPDTTKRRVVFNDDLVTQVFISSPATDDEDEEDDDDDAYDEYDYDDGEEEDDEVANDENNPVHLRPSALIDHGHAEAELDEDSDDYSYYYSSNAGNSTGYLSQQEVPDGTARSAIEPLHSSNAAQNGRRVSIAPSHMGQVPGEYLDDSDFEDEPIGNPESSGHHGSPTNSDAAVAAAEAATSGRFMDPHEKPILSHLVADPSKYCLSNDDSDEGDSLTSALHRMSDNRDSVETGRFTLRIFHVGSHTTSEAAVTVFLDEMFSEVLRRSLSLFNLHVGISNLALHAQVQQGEILSLTNDTQVASLFDHLRSVDTAHQLSDSGYVPPELCAIVLADRSTPRSQLSVASAEAEDDPYMSLGMGSRSVLRTSIAASVSEGISGLAPSVRVASKSGSSSPSSSIEVMTTPASQPKSLSPNSSQYLSTAENQQESLEDRPPSVAEPGAATLPDSRKVVQGLLRNIPPPKSRPSLTALNRAKRNTLQLSADGSLATGGSGEHAVTRSLSHVRTAPASDHSAMLGRSLSTREHSSDSQHIHLHDINTRNLPTSTTRALSFPSQATPPSDPANINQALGQSASTLRPSSDTFTNDNMDDDAHQTALAPVESHISDGNGDGNEAQMPLSGPADDADECAPVSPISSTETASIDGSNSDIVSRPAITAALSATASHRSLKEIGSDPSSHGVALPPSDELSLDDWLVILRGWNDMSDIAASTSSFYHSFLKDLQNVTPAAPKHASSGGAQDDAVVYIYHQITELQTANSETQSAIDDILSVSQGVGRRLDTLEHELDDIVRVMVCAN
ncbi:protein phosphatase regulator [Coemansia spiralis]|uniref:Protein phosphatase regulator n=1 Tax=Coemansia spiralis TaxID=417178 RepID=A0A9W8GID8_9FUNG|nr:protein phosphatase regulator [Coemansia spiralis]